MAKDIITDFSSLIASKLDTKKVQNFLNSDKSIYKIKLFHGSSGAVFLSAIWHKTNIPLLVLCHTESLAEEYYHDLKVLTNPSITANLTKPLKSVKYHEKEDDNFSWLIDGLTKSISNNNGIAVGTPEIMDYKIPEPEQLINDELEINLNDKIDFTDFTYNLSKNGFSRTEHVAEQGEFAVRGGIVDIFPIAWDNPVRIEFWGDEIESIREFNSISQRSVRSFNSVKFIANVYNKENSILDSDIFDYLPDNTLIVLIEPNLLDFEKEKINSYKQLEINGLEKANQVIKTEPQPDFGGMIKPMLRKAAELFTTQYKIAITADGKISKNRIKELFEGNLHSIFLEELNELGLKQDVFSQNILWTDNTLSKGFIDHENRLAIFTEHEIFGRQRRRERKIKKSAESYSLQELRQLNIGDYIVHEDKGIGKFEGFQTVQMGGSNQDCIRLVFAESSVLYVNLNYIHKIQKYSASEGALPKLSKLGSTEWARKKSKTKKRLKDIARDLIKLYAKRKLQQGFAFPADDVWQKEFEASFVYEDTPDQSRSTEETKRDMESETPMDRLICGDVGFGKTEVAIRAAFKAVQAGKQVSVLVPTTILAQQHYMSFKDRLSRYPINVDVISRFRTKKEQTEILEKNQNGRLDILIGTHRLLSKDIKFKDLGLLIIDEEHRFGVSAKEKLRELRASIDTLTLTATPIPRTLNFSLMGARDLSLIETPPRNRIPVETEIMEWENDVIQDAMTRELERGGQIFFVSDKVNDLENIAIKLQMLMPKVKFGIAHGQMKPTELEKVMQDFIQRKFDVLVATKIVESGIDIPNANTIFINRANNFGLAELYQLRGRVGRTNKQAYCYLIIPPFHKIQSKALKRLQALEEFTDLGSGFKLAMRDMEIRGAGNLLGAEQSGFIIDIGFELFQKILEEAVQELKNEEFSDLFEQDDDGLDFTNEEIAIELDEDSFLPQTYVENNTERFNYYRKLYKLQNNKELGEIVEEIKDKYGKLPKEAENLIFAVKVRIASMKTGFSKISIKKDMVICEFPPSENELYYQEAFPLIIDYVKEDMPQANLKQTKKKLYLEIPVHNKENAIELLWKIKRTTELV